MEIYNKYIDAGKGFDWGKTSEDYAKFRDIYPPEFYERIVRRGLCIKGQRVLDLGTGTGVLPRNLYRYGAVWTGTDISENQIAQAERLSKERGYTIEWKVASAENVDFPENSFDVVTACQCFFYFDHEKLMPKLARILKPGGSLLILYMAWLPFEDVVAGESEKLVLKYNPQWSGAGETRHSINVPACALSYFDVVAQEEYDLKVPFTRETWHGRMRACRGVGASLQEAELGQWEVEHRKLLEENAPEEFEVLHYAALAELRVKK